MTLLTVVLLIVAVLAVAALFAVIALVVAARLARRPDRAPIRSIPIDRIDDYFDYGAGFAVTVSAVTGLDSTEVFDRLGARPYLSSLPFLSGPFWEDDELVAGARRHFSGTFYSVSEQVVSVAKNEEITMVGTAVCTPATISSFAERFTVSRGPSAGELRVDWTIAGTPQWVGWLPWRLGAPLTKPVFAFVLRHVLRPKTFRAPSRR